MVEPLGQPLHFGFAAEGVSVVGVLADSVFFTIFLEGGAILDSDLLGAFSHVSGLWV